MDEDYAIKLFCLPYAGGSISIFNSWGDYLNSSIKLIPIELAGRGSRIGQPHYISVDKAVDDIFKIIAPEIINRPYALFGHSMGSMLIYELARKIKLAKLSGPQHIFFSGRHAPCVKRTKGKNYHLLAEKEFKLKVMDLGGTPPKFFKHPELIELFLPLLRNDFRLAATNFNKREIFPFDCDISVFFGKDEDISAKGIANWKNHTKEKCTINFFKGGHFFLNERPEEVVRFVNDVLVKNVLV